MNGILLIAIGFIHQILGLVMACGLIAPPQGPPRNLLAEMARAGVIGSVEPDPMRMTFFWYFSFGLAILILGALMRSLEREGQRLPSSLGWQLGALGIFGGLLIPVSRLWLVLPLAFRIVRMGRRQR